MQRVKDAAVMLKFVVGAPRAAFGTAAAGEVCWFAGDPKECRLMYLFGGTLRAKAYNHPFRGGEPVAPTPPDAPPPPSWNWNFGVFPGDGKVGRIGVSATMGFDKKSVDLEEIGVKGAVLHRFTVPDGAEVTGLQCHPALRQVAVATQGRKAETNTVSIHRLNDETPKPAPAPPARRRVERPVRPLELVADLPARRRIEAPIRSLRYSPDGALLAAGAADGVGRVWRTSDGEEVASLMVSRFTVLDMAFVGERHLACATTDGAEAGNLKLFDLEGGKVVAHVPADTAGLQRVAYHPGSDALATLGSDNLVKLWRVGELLPAAE